MKNTLKIIAGLAVAIVVVLVLVATYLITTFDANAYKEQITALVKRETGRNLTITGDIQLHVFPWLGIQIGATRLDNPAGFTEPDFISFTAISIKTRLLPLFHKQIESDTITLQGLTANLLTNKQGQNNWSLRAAAPPQAESGTSSTTKPPSPMVPPVLRINGIDIQDATIVWRDELTSVHYTIDHLQLHSGPVSLGENIKFNSSMTVHGEDLPDGSIDISLQAETRYDPERQQLDINQLQLQLLGLTIDSRIQLRALATTPDMTGQLTLAKFNPRELLTRMGGDISTTDPQALTSALLDMRFTATADQAEISSLNLTLDDSHLNASAKITDFTTPRIRLNLDLDQINLDRYLPPPAATTISEPANSAPTGSTAFNLPLNLLHTLDVKATTEFGKLTIAQLMMSDIIATITVKNGQLALFPFAANLYGGQAKGRLELDARQTKPKFTLQESLSNIDIGALLHDLVDSDLLVGRSNAELSLTSQGVTPLALRQQLQGHARLSFTDGALNGINVVDMIHRAKAKIENKPEPGATGQQTDFTTLQASVEIKNGIATNTDLTAQAPYLRISGQGKADLVQEMVDYQLRAKIVDSEQGQGGADLASLKGTTIPIIIRGPFTGPDIQLDSAAIRDSLKQQARQQLREKTEQKQDEIKQELQEKLKNKLKSLF